MNELAHIAGAYSRAFTIGGYALATLAIALALYAAALYVRDRREALGGPLLRDMRAAGCSSSALYNVARAYHRAALREYSRASVARLHGQGEDARRLVRRAIRSSRRAALCAYYARRLAGHTVAESRVAHLSRPEASR